ncbi:unnamed protein product, partial [Ectocarpus sp. 8 AP-2014]
RCWRAASRSWLSLSPPCQETPPSSWRCCACPAPLCRSSPADTTHLPAAWKTSAPRRQRQPRAWTTPCREGLSPRRHRQH